VAAAAAGGSISSMFGTSGANFGVNWRGAGYQKLRSDPDCFSFNGNTIVFGGNTIGGEYLVQILANSASGNFSNFNCSNSQGLTLLDSNYNFPADGGITSGNVAQGHYATSFYNNGSEGSAASLVFTVTGPTSLSKVWVLITETAYLTSLGFAREPDQRQKEPMYLMAKKMEEMQLSFERKLKALEARVVFHDEDEEQDFPIVRVEEAHPSVSNTSTGSVILSQSMVRTLLGATSQAK